MTQKLCLFWLLIDTLSIHTKYKGRHVCIDISKHIANCVLYMVKN